MANDMDAAASRTDDGEKWPKPETQIMWAPLCSAGATKGVCEVRKTCGQSG